ncbi:MAG: heme ABC transporter ATP-binding protein [Chitinophagaceae bacterium]
MLRTKDVAYSIGSKQILKGITLDFTAGEFAMILGPNGSGKSTYLKIFSGEINKFEGEVWYDEKPINAIQKEQLSTCRAVMSQQTELSFPLTVEEVVMMGRYPHFSFNPNKKDIAICDEVIVRMNLETFRERNYTTLSGGEKQRVQYARVLAQIWENPSQGNRYLFLDEPLNNLDIAYQQDFLAMARVLKNENTVLVAVMHDINLAIQYADKLVFFKEGAMVASGRPKELVNATLLKDVFDVKTTVIDNPVNGEPLVVFG